MIGEIHMRIPSIQLSCICFSPFSIREEDDARKKKLPAEGKKVFTHDELRGGVAAATDDENVQAERSVFADL